MLRYQHDIERKMAKRSFLSYIIGGSYYELKPLAICILKIGTPAFIVLFIITNSFYWGFLGAFFHNFISDLLCIAYMVSMIIGLDIEVEVEEKVWPVSKSKLIDDEYRINRRYVFTIMWSVVLAILGVLFYCWFTRYGQHYYFDSGTYYVDHQAKIYHLSFDEMTCPIEYETNNLDLMRGYQIDKSYTLCPWCESKLELTEQLFYMR